MPLQIRAHLREQERNDKDGRLASALRIGGVDEGPGTPAPLDPTGPGSALAPPPPLRPTSLLRQDSGTASGGEWKPPLEVPGGVGTVRVHTARCCTPCSRLRFSSG